MKSKRRMKVIAALTKNSTISPRMTDPPGDSSIRMPRRMSPLEIIAEKDHTTRTSLAEARIAMEEAALEEDLEQIKTKMVKVTRTVPPMLLPAKTLLKKIMEEIKKLLREAEVEVLLLFQLDLEAWAAQVS